MADKPATDTGSDQDTGAPEGESNEALLAELEAEQGAAGKGKAAKPAKADPDDEDDEVDADLESDDDDDDGSDDAESDEDNEEDESDDDDEEPAQDEDPARAKRQASLERNERRFRETMQRERADFDRERQAFDRERTSWESGRGEGQKRFEAAVARAKIDPAGVLEALGLTPEDMEYAATQAYARGKAAATDPKYRTAAEQARRAREIEERAAKAEERVEKVEKTLEEKAKQAEADREVDAYLAKIVRKASDEHPRVKALIAKSSTTARRELEQTAFELAQKLGKLPSAKLVLAAHEKKIGRMLRRYGVDVVAAAAAADTEQKPTEKPAAKVVPGKKGKPAKGAAKVEADDAPNGEIRHPSTAELLRELRTVGAS